MIHKRGEILILSCGEYSDYYVNLLCRVLKDFEEHEVANKYDCKEDNYDFDSDEFVAYLIREKYIEEIDYVEWNFATYGRLEFSDDK